MIDLDSLKNRTTDWAKTALLLVGSSWGESDLGICDLYGISKHLKFRWFWSYRKPRAQLSQLEPQPRWLNQYNIGGSNPFLFYALSRYRSVDLSELKAIEDSVRSFFPLICIPTCLSCEDRFDLDQITGDWYCSTCAEILQPKIETDKTGFVYMFGSSGDRFYKIGASKQPPSRMKDYVKSKLPFPVDMIHQIPVDDKFKAEAELHRLFRSEQTNGEWFKLTGDDVSKVVNLRGYKAGRWLKREG